MKTLIISSSLNPSSHSAKVCIKFKAGTSKSLTLNPSSHSAKVCKEIAEKLKNLGVEVTYVDLKKQKLSLHWQKRTADMDNIQKAVEQADNYIFGIAIYNFSLNDSLKLVLDNCFPGAEHKLFGMVAAAGGERSYLATSHLVQICMNEWRMIALPRTVYITGKDIDEDNRFQGDICDRIDRFINDFYQIGKKLLN